MLSPEPWLSLAVKRNSLYSQWKSQCWLKPPVFFSIFSGLSMLSSNTINLNNIRTERCSIYPISAPPQRWKNYKTGALQFFFLTMCFCNITEVLFRQMQHLPILTLFNFNRVLLILHYSTSIHVKNMTYVPLQTQCIHQLNVAYWR